AGLVPEFLKTVEARIERGLAATRKSHQHNALRVDAGMFGQDFQRAIDIDDEIEPAELRLVGVDVREPAPGETVDHEGRNADCVELMRPGFDGGRDAA